MTKSQWHAALQAHHSHFLQSWAWGEFKAKFGWAAHHLQTDQAAAQILFRRLPLGLTIGYVPKGPLLDWNDEAAVKTTLSRLRAIAKQQGAIFLKIEPPVAIENETVRQWLLQSGFQAADTIQPNSTSVVDIRGDEADILARMKQKTRYNIRLAARKGVSVRVGSGADMPTFYQLSQLTATRDGFAIHDLAYYQTVYDGFAPDDCALLLAEFEGQPLAALMVFRHQQTAYYVYGASSNERRNLMPTYLIQWEAMRWARALGCTQYDLWGLPDADAATLEAEFQHRHDGLWGVYRFKRGFNGQLERSLGAFDQVYRPLLYRLYRWRRGISD